MLESNLSSQFPCYLLLFYVRSFITYCISAPTLNTQPSGTEYMCPTYFMRRANDQETVCHASVSFVFHPAHVVIAVKLCYVIACSSHLTYANYFCDTGCSALEMRSLAFSLHISLFDIMINEIGLNEPWFENFPPLVLF